MAVSEKSTYTILTHICLATFLRDIGKQCRTRADAAKSVSPLFALDEEDFQNGGLLA